MALTAVSSLLQKYNINRRDIGRIEVGTETLLDKSKSVKSVLMQLFSDVNTNIVGVDNINACYGGTAALLNAVDWCESSAWDGRCAIVVAGDIAIYGKGAARPTGGAGVVAILVGHDAPIELHPGLRGSYFQHAYDFYKPDLRSEYPVVNGAYSMECYTRALDACYEEYKRREQHLTRLSTKGDVSPTSGSDSGVDLTGLASDEDTKRTPSHPELATDRFDYMAFHSPVAKLVSKSYGRLAYNDFKAHPSHPTFAQLDPALTSPSYEASLTDRSIEKAFTAHSSQAYNDRVRPCMLAPTQVGNTYTGSLYTSLASLIAGVAPETLHGKSIGMFSYGSGLASTMFSLHVRGDTSEMRVNLDLEARLDNRHVVSPEKFEHVSPLPSPSAACQAGGLCECQRMKRSHG